MPQTPVSPELHESLTRRLQHRLTPVEVSKLADVIAELTDNGIDIDEVFPYGMTPKREHVSIRGTLTAAELAKLGSVIPKLELKDYKIFPRGIINPERYRLHLNLNLNR